MATERNGAHDWLVQQALGHALKPKDEPTANTRPAGQRPAAFGHDASGRGNRRFRPNGR